MAGHGTRLPQPQRRTNPTLLVRKGVSGRIPSSGMTPEEMADLAHLRRAATS